MVKKECPVFQFVPMASGSVSGHHWKEPGSVLFAPSFQVFIHIDKFPLRGMRDHLPSSLLLASLLLMQPRVPAAFVPRVHCWLLFGLAAPESFSAKLLPSRVAPRIYWCPRHRTLQFFLLICMRLLHCSYIQQVLNGCVINNPKV